jgi:hypothetical protein
MIVRFALLFLAVAATALPALAADPLSYDDPGMHYSAPTGWTRVPLPPHQDGDDEQPAALFVYRAGQYNARSIVVKIVDSTEDLGTFESEQEEALRAPGDATYVKKRQPLQLTNGMPAFLLESTTSGDTGASISRFEYVVIDGQRGITVTYVGSTSDVDEKTALAALSTLYVVAYPRRPQS